MLRFLHRLSLLVTTTATVAAARLEITIAPQFQGEPLRLDSLRYQNSAGETLSVTKLSYLLSGFALERGDGTWLEFPDFHAWMDATSRRQVLNLENIPNAKYRAVRLHIGPPPADNAADPSKFPAQHPLNAQLNGLHWSWQGGYIFLALEGHFRTANQEIQGYTWHLARDPHRTRIALTAPLDLRRDAGLLIHFDVATLLNAPHPLSFERNGTATHSREGDPIAPALCANLPGAFHVQRVVSAAPPVAPGPPVVPIDLPEHYTPYAFTMSRRFPIPELPRDNPLIVERVALGKRLFHEKSLSRNDTISCATCHLETHGFTDARATSIGIDGRQGDFNSMPLFNLAWKSNFFWDGRAETLRAQVLMPIADHREMDLSPATASNKLAAMDDYQTLFNKAFASPGITPEKMALALEQYLLTLVTGQSRFDKAMNGTETLTEIEKRGFELFITESDPRTGQRGADCFHCHGGPLFTDHQFHNNGLANAGQGRASVTGSSADRGKFITPSLRNISRTAPYMHDGRFATLEEVIDHYSTGVHRSPALDPNLAKHPGTGLNLSRKDKDAIIAFLHTLTDP